MILYYVIRKTDLNKINIEYHKLETFLDREGLFIILESNEVPEIFLHEMFVSNIHARVLEPWLSEYILERFIDLSPFVDIDRRPATELTLTQRLFNNAFCNESDVKGFNSLNEIYYDYGEMTNKGQHYIRTATWINKELDRVGMLIKETAIRPSLFSFLVQSIKSVNLEELENDFSIEEIDERNKTFNELVIAELILRASDYYSKEEIKEFIKGRILDGDI